MPNSPSAKKRVRQNETRRLHNRTIRSTVRTHIRKVVEAIEAKDVETAKASFRLMESRLDKAARKGVIHRNAAARKKARLARRLRAIGAD